MKRFLSLLVSLVLLFALLSGCAAVDMSSKAAPREDGNYAYNDANSMPEAGLENTSGTLTEARKLIKTVEVHLQTERFDDLVAALGQSVTDVGGYIEQSELQGKTSYRRSRYVSYVLRVPVQELDGFSAGLSDLGVVTSSSSSQEDVTLTYVDLEAHLTALNTERDSLLRLLEQAESVEDIISIQSRISDVQYELECYTSQLRSYDNLIDYATVHLYVNEVAHEDEVEETTSVWAQIGQNLKSAVRGIGRFFRGAFIVLVSALPYLAVVTVIVLPILYFTVFRRIRKRRKAQKEQE